MSIDIVNRHNNESCTLRLNIYNDDGMITDIIEGPMRFIITYAMKHVSPDTKLELRKVRK